MRPETPAARGPATFPRRPRQSLPQWPRDNVCSLNTKNSTARFRMQKRRAEYSRFRPPSGAEAAPRSENCARVIRFRLRVSAWGQKKAVTKHRSESFASAKKSARGCRRHDFLESRPDRRGRSAAGDRGSDPVAHSLARRPGIAQRQHARPFHLHPRDQPRRQNWRARQPRLHSDAKCRRY